MGDQQSASLPAEDTYNAENYSGQKECVRRDVYVAFDAENRRKSRATADAPCRFGHGEGMAQVVDARWWMARNSDGASPVYCSVWIRTRDGRYISGHGKARGYGYHKDSAALEDALENAGVKMAQGFGGAGDGSIRDALRAIAKAAGYGRCPWGIV